MVFLSQGSKFAEIYRKVLHQPLGVAIISDQFKFTFDQSFQSSSLVS